MNTISRWRAALATMLVLAVMTTRSAQAQTFTTLYSFCSHADCADGATPLAGLIRATDGNLYGTTVYGGGADGFGTVFQITPSGALTTLHNFLASTDGARPAVGLVQAAGGDFYGETSSAGANGQGTVFRMTPDGILRSLYSVCPQGTHPNCTTGTMPVARLIQANHGNLYGVMHQGGSYGYGTVFKITPSGTPTMLYSFCAEKVNCTDGANPNWLIQARDGDLYGTTTNGGANGLGTVFKITPSGTQTTLHSFAHRYPAGLVQATNGNFYGVMYEGGGKNLGSIFQITCSGTLTILYSFQGIDGGHPTGLIQGSDGNFYGTTAVGGAHDKGSIFQFTPSGTLTTLYSFCSEINCRDGTRPTLGLVQATDGNFYGTTSSNGGVNRAGTVFGLSLGLGPFVSLQATSGAAGTAVNILGNNLTGTVSVTFNGIAATFTVVSDFEITTRVPIAATTGIVEVITPGGTLSSDVVYTVEQKNGMSGVPAEIGQLHRIADRQDQ